MQPNPNPSAEQPRRLGLREVRESRNIRLEAISQETKLSVRFLRAIEEEDFAVLPGGVYNVSYIRQYAAGIGYDESSLLAWYREKMGIRNEEPVGTPPSHDSSLRSLLGTLLWPGHAGRIS